MIRNKVKLIKSPCLITMKWSINAHFKSKQEQLTGGVSNLQSKVIVLETLDELLTFKFFPPPPTIL